MSHRANDYPFDSYLCCHILNHYSVTMKRKRFIRNAFQQYLAPELVNQLLANPKSLKFGGSLQEITVLFSDIRNFTSCSKTLSSGNSQFLHKYLTEMVKIIINNHGILDKFVGDEIMALYEHPVPFLIIILMPVKQLCK